MARFEHRFYKSVAPYTTDSLDYTPANNEVVYPEVLGGDSPLSPDARVVIVWDPTGVNKIIFCTYMSASTLSYEALIGDGVKVLRINLINNTSDTKEMGGFTLAQNNL